MFPIITAGGLISTGDLQSLGKGHFQVCLLRAQINLVVIGWNGQGCRLNLVRAPCQKIMRYVALVQESQAISPDLKWRDCLVSERVLCFDSFMLSSFNSCLICREIAMSWHGFFQSSLNGSCKADCVSPVNGLICSPWCSPCRMNWRHFFPKVIELYCKKHQIVLQALFLNNFGGRHHDYLIYYFIASSEDLYDCLISYGNC